MRFLCDIDLRRPVHLISLLLAALLLGLFLGLPLGHQLFHDGPTEPENCPVHMLESSLVLLFIALIARALWRSPRARFAAILWSVPLLSLCCLSPRSPRAPPLF